MMSLSCANRNAEKRKMVKEGYSVAFPDEGSSVPFELKVWHKSPDYMCLVVREDPGRALRRLKVGQRVRMNYYAVDLERPSERLETEVVSVKESLRGRAKGQYLVDLQILRSYH